MSVPKGDGAFKQRAWTSIAMELIGDKCWGLGWVNWNAHSRTKWLAQLKEMVDKMRSIPCPQGQDVSDIDGGPMWNCRLPGP